MFTIRPHNGDWNSMAAAAEKYAFHSSTPQAQFTIREILRPDSAEEVARNCHSVTLKARTLHFFMWIWSMFLLQW